MKIKFNLDKIIINTAIGLLMIKILFSYINVEFGWWQRDLIPNFDKYNFLGLPDDYSKKIEFLLIPLIGIYILKNLKYLRNKSMLTLVGIVMIGLNILTSIFTSTPILSSLEYSLKLMSPIFLFVCLLIHYEKYQFDIKKMMVRILIFCCCLSLIGYLFLEGSYNHNKIWLPIYFSSVHTHSYVLVIIAIGFSYLLYEKRKYKEFLIFTAFYLAFLYFGHRVRTPMVLYLVYIFFITILMHDYFKFIWVNLIIFIPILGMFYLLFSDFNLNEFSSGRMVMYEAKYEMLKGYNVLEYLFGRGKGSDFIVTDYWIRQEKNSHNDLLTFFVENGIPYTFLFLFMIFSLMIVHKKIKIIYSGIVLGYLLTSFLSNGLVLRPIASYLLFIVLAYIAVNPTDLTKKKNMFKYKLKL